MTQQEHNKTISAKAFNLLCDEIPFFGIVQKNGYGISEAKPEEVAEAMKNDYDINSFYYDPKLGRIVAILWEE